MTASSYPDDGLGEVFLKMSKQGSTLAGVMDAFSIAISIGLQYGVPLETYVGKFTNMRFEPAGMTDDPDIRMAASVVDYIFRRLALDFLPYRAPGRARHLHRQGAGRAGPGRGRRRGVRPGRAGRQRADRDQARRSRQGRRQAGEAGRRPRSAPRWSCWRRCSTRRPTLRCASPAARRCGRPAAATSARAAAPPAAAADPKPAIDQGVNSGDSITDHGSYALDRPNGWRAVRGSGSASGPGTRSMSSRTCSRAASRATPLMSSSS